MTSCLLPAWFAAVSGSGPPLDLHEPLTAAWSVTPPPITGKAYPFAPADYVYDTDNFTVQWDDPDIPESLVTVVANNVEEAWSVYVEADGWAAPPTSDSHRILVYLEPELEAAGLANLVDEPHFPEGVPIIYLNPEYFAEYPTYFEGVVHHEFSHTIQFSLRDWYGGGPEEWWYWEASSSWMQKHVRPGTHHSAWWSSYYADDSTTAFDTVDYGHEYGMYILNMYLEELAVGRLGFQSIWMDNEGASWLAEIERVTAEPPEVTWAKFAGAYIGRQLSDAADLHYPILESEPRVIDGHLGAQYLNIGTPEGVLWLDGGIGTLLRDEAVYVFTDSVEIPDGMGAVTLVVTNPDSEPLEYGFTVEAGSTDTGEPDTGGPNTGDPDTGGPGTGDTDAGSGEPEPEPDSTEPHASKARNGFGCTTGTGSMWLWWSGLLAVSRRRCGSG